MAFPVIEGRSVTAFSADQTSHTISLPAGITAGDYLVMVFAKDGASGTVTPPSGWTQKQGGTGVDAAYVFDRTADGSESGTVTVSTSVSDSSSAIVWRISGVLDCDVAIETGGGNSSFSRCPAVTADRSAESVQICCGALLGIASLLISENGGFTATANYGNATSNVSLFALDAPVVTISGLAMPAFSWVWGSASVNPRFTILCYGTESSGSGSARPLSRILNSGA